ncbi:MAG: hypothetical protein H6510_04905 [Acidobacteria bacterium]|nr:hypothetical protein [Acidobacteriota bacterium]
MENEMTVDDLRCDWEEDGELKVEQLDKFVLSKGAWVTIMFLYRERQPSGDWSESKCRIQRYKKIRGKYSIQSKFNISSAKQAHMIVDQLQKWYPQT